MPYTAHVIMQRALPEIDGFKPSQRRILYTMYKMNLLNGGRKKSQGIVGQTMFLHPHGDMAIYETLVRMTIDNESFLIPYIDSKGNFGKIYSRDMQFASARYTEAKLSDVARELFKDINKNTVDMVDNYDGTYKEPRLLPVTFPSILTNSQSGTAVGMASNIPSFNLSEVIDYTIAHIKDDSVNPADYIIAPDFPTGGNIIYNKDDFEKIYNTGRGSFKVRATYKIDENSIIFEDIPFTTTFEAIIERITALVKEGKIKDIINIDDIYGINSKGIEITVKNNTDKKTLVEKLFSMTTLEDSFSCNFNLIVNGSPQVLGVKSIINEWISFRSEAIRRGAMFDRDEKMNKRHLLSALEQVMLDIDKAISIIRETKKSDDVTNNLMKEFNIDKEQADFVSNIRLRNLNEEYLINQTKAIKKLSVEIDSLDKLIDNDATLNKYIIDELTEIKNSYGKDRVTGIIKSSEIPSIDIDEVSIDNYNIKIFVTEEGYLKKTPLTSLRGNFNIRVKDGDRIINEIETTNNSEILIFTDKHNVYKYKSYELENHRPSELGEYLPTLLGLEDENIVFVTATNNFEENLLIGFSDGRLAKIQLSAYETRQNRVLLRNAYAKKDAIFWHVLNKDEEIDILCLSSIDKVLISNTERIGAKSSRSVQGNIFMSSKDESDVVAYYVDDFDSYDESDYYRIKSAGVGKYLRKGDFGKLVKNKT